jgi:hypothetical protein
MTPIIIKEDPARTGDLSNHVAYFSYYAVP